MRKTKKTGKKKRGEQEEKIGRRLREEEEWRNGRVMIGWQGVDRRGYHVFGEAVSPSWQGIHCKEDERGYW